MREKPKPNQWDSDDTFGSDILGNGSAWGDMRGKVKTVQIGFIRAKPKAKSATNVSRKVSVSNKGRS